MNKALLLFLLGVGPLAGLSAQTGLQLQGQASLWTNYRQSEGKVLEAGCRYIPQLHIQHAYGSRLADIEASANLRLFLQRTTGWPVESSGDLRAYRLWVRYSAPQLEIRLGLQKINFGSAVLIRPLMWFDQVDPRDPLQLTTGVWALLGRYYALNNANLWFWLLRPSEELKSWEIYHSRRGHPEAGGRLQLPVPKGEIGLTTHFRSAEARRPGAAEVVSFPESRIGLDGRWDWIAGFWFEGVWIRQRRGPDLSSGETLLTLGADYTFGIGSGLTAVLENLWYATASAGPGLSGARTLAALSLAYAPGVNSRLSVILYADREQDTIYRFLQWRSESGDLALHLIAFWNPHTLLLHARPGGGASAYSGRGGQIMIVYTH
ncbi:MAG TPA: hypothetical protein PKI62_02780 [bacterium]|nr:hypothetical protein [bacterium]HPR87047.1 hypothetical protein [bacterium]